MKQIDLLRSMPLEEVARGRIKAHEIAPRVCIYVGDFVGYVEFWPAVNGNRDEAYAEALRLEIAWLESEAEGEK